MIEGKIHLKNNDFYDKINFLGTYPLSLETLPPPLLEIKSRMENQYICCLTPTP